MIVQILLMDNVLILWNFWDQVANHKKIFYAMWSILVNFKQFYIFPNSIKFSRKKDKGSKFLISIPSVGFMTITGC